jgi:hypothetical protein
MTFVTCVWREPAKGRQSPLRPAFCPGLKREYTMSARRPLAILAFSVFGLLVLGVIGFIAWRAWNNGGLMPQPNPLRQYRCPAPAGAYSLYYRHGRSEVELRSSAPLLRGSVHEGRINWAPWPQDQAAPVFAFPLEISYESAAFIRVRDSAQQQLECPAQP